jgi:hypothetical protein
MLASPYVIDFFAHEFACLRRGRFPLACIVPRAFPGFLIIRGRHDDCSFTDTVAHHEKM